MRLQLKNSNIYRITKSLGLLFILLFFSSGFVFCDNLPSKADTIISNVLNNRAIYGSYISEYEAEVYLKGNSHVRKKNVLYQYAPDFLYLDRKGESSFMESIVDIHFKSPNHFIQKIKAINGSNVNLSNIEERVMQFLTMNVYNPTLFSNLVLLPDEKEVLRYYRVEYIESIDTLGYLVHKIRYEPKIRSLKLLNGYLYVLDKFWAILEFDVWGKWNFSDYRVETKFGLPGEDDFLLPKETRISFSLNLLGNKTDNNYYSSYKYKYINKGEDGKDPPTTGYDLSRYFSIQLDSLPYVKDKKFWEENRTEPLTAYEKEFLEKQQIRESKKDTVPEKSPVVHFAQGTIAPKRYRYNNSSLTYSGLVNPFKLAYSKLDGVVYWQQFRFRQVRESGREFRLQPNIGFLFKSKEVYFRVPLNWVFQPKRFGEFNFNFGNKNQTYGYRTQQMIDNEIPDSLDFKDLNLDYFHHYNLMVNGRYEIRNGLILESGLDYSWHIPVKSKSPDGAPQIPVEDDDVIDIMQNHYRTFSPYVNLTWTPKQYYRIIGKRKEYVYSNYPTLSFEYARGIKGVFKSSSDYERFEIDIQQRIPIRLMHSFQYYIGAGTFTNTRSFYFADFSYFQKRNFPESWDDPLGGVFHLLDGKWYNASDSYVQAHFMYETPFIVFQFFRGVTKDILKERFYVSQLYTPELPCYTELGYSVGNFLGNIGVFVSLDKGKFDGVGAKFAFELGR